MSDVLLKHRGGHAKNNLLNILKKIEDIDIAISCSSDSPYIDPTEFVTYISKYKKQFCILSVNIQSIRAKFDAFSVFIQSLANIDFYFSVICIQESWISSEVSCDVVYEIPGYKTFTLPSTCSAHAGLITYVLDTYNCTTLNCYQSSTTWECLPLVLSSGGLKRNVTILNTYRPPRDRNADIQVFLDVFTETLESLSIKNKDVLVAGDFNIDLLKIDNRSLYTSYLESMYSVSLVPSITLPTRLSKNNATLIDHIFCSFSKSTTPYSAGIITSSISDHFMTFLCADIKTEYTKPPKFILHQTKTPNAIASFTNEIIETDFMSMLNHNVNTDPNDNYEKIKTILTRAVDKHLPTKLVKFKKQTLTQTIYYAGYCALN